MNIYLDNNILVYYSLPNAKAEFKQASEEIFNTCKSGKNTGVISNLTLTELAGTCQRYVYDDFKNKQINKEELLNYVRTRGLDVYSEVVDALLAMPYIKLESTMNLTFQDIIFDALKVMKETSGRLVYRSKSVEFTRAYMADILHVLLARHVKCDEFHTFDKGIKKLETHPKILPMQIILHHR